MIEKKNIRKKKILLLGGSEQQIIAIKKAKQLGYSTIVCDYLKDNPGQFIADKFYLASTTDRELILGIAKKEDIDGIIAYASDPAAPTASYVCEKMNLPGNPLESVEILCEKDKFREFLLKNNFNTPKSNSYYKIEDAVTDLSSGYFKLPVMVKPVDSSGSKGVSKIEEIKDCEEKINLAFSFSKSKKIIIEEYVKGFGFQVAGDGLSIDGKLVFRYFANDHFDQGLSNPYVPIAASFPYVMPEEIHKKIHREIQRLLDLLNMKDSTYNFDIRMDDKCNVYLMEVAPRSGGNYIPQVIKYATGVDMVEYAVKMAMGEKVAYPSIKETDSKYWAYYAVHSYNNGVLKKIKIRSDVIKNNIVENHIVKKPKDYIESFRGANSTLGILIMKFESMEQMLDMMENSKEWISIILED